MWFLIIMSIITLLLFWFFIYVEEYEILIHVFFILFAIWCITSILKTTRSKTMYSREFIKIQQLDDNNLVKVQPSNYVFKWNDEIHVIEKDDVQVKINDDSTYLEIERKITIFNEEDHSFFILNPENDTITSINKYILHFKK